MADTPDTEQKEPVPLPTPQEQYRIDDRLTTVEVELSGLKDTQVQHGHLLGTMNTKLTEMSTVLAAAVQPKGIPVGHLIASLSAIAVWSGICAGLIWLVVAPVADDIALHEQLGYHASAGERISSVESDMKTTMADIDDLERGLSAFVTEMHLKTQERYTKTDAKYDHEQQKFDLEAKYGLFQTALHEVALESRSMNSLQVDKIDKMISRLGFLEGMLQQIKEPRAKD